MNNFENLLEYLIEKTYVSGLLADLESNLGMQEFTDRGSDVFVGLDKNKQKVYVYINRDDEFKVVYKNKTVLTGDRYNEQEVKKLWQVVSKLVDRSTTWANQV